MRQFPSRACGVAILLAAVLSSLPIVGLSAADSPAEASLKDVEWGLHGLDTGETRHSPLDQINPSNVSSLGLAWSHEFESRRGIEATPIVVDNRMYVTGPWSVVHCFVAVTGEHLWTWDPKVDKAIYGRRACCDVVNRGVNYADGKVFVGVLDGRLVALNAKTGEPVWEVVTLDQTKNYTITGAPRIAGDKVMIGNGGAEYGVRGYITAYEIATGKQAWRFYTVPGNPADGFESETMKQAAETWTGTWWEAGGGGTCWDSMAYDPELNFFYVGVGNGSPWNRKHRSPGGGDNLYLSSIVALNADSGELVWHYQTTPGDTWDYTATQHMILADIQWKGQERPVLMQAPKNGFFYVLDRKTGELLAADAYTSITWAESVDLKTGRPREKAGADYQEGRARIKPGPDGAHNWHPMSYSPETGYVYFPLQEIEIAYRHQEDYEYDPRQWNLGLHIVGGGIGDPPGYLVAWDPVKKKRVWEVPRPIMWNGGVLSTAGGLVFQGTGAGTFNAYHARTGEALWSTFCGTGIIAAPVTFQIDGVQHVTIAAGWGGAHGLRNPPAGEAAQYEQVGRLLTYKLGGREKMPSLKPRPAAMLTGPEVRLEYSREDVRAGARLHGNYCGRCHGNGYVVPSLKYASKEAHQLWELIVYEGLYAPGKGMPSFKDALTREQVRQIQAFVVEWSRGEAARQEN